MNISKAIFFNKVSPEIVCKDLYSIVLGFEELEIQNNRQVNYFDLFIMFAFYNYKTAIETFENIRYDKYTSFKNKVERNPDIFVNIKTRYSMGIPYCRNAILYGVSNNLFTLDDDFNIRSIKNSKIQINKSLKNIGKVFSTKQTTELYSYFEVDINEI